MVDVPVANAGEIPSPALLVVRERVEANLRRMLEIAGGPERLRPHVKTHKTAELVRRQIELGIRRFKCATVAEAEMTAAAGAADVLLALQPVGPHARRFLALRDLFPATRFSVTIDDLRVAGELARLAGGKAPVEVLLDLDVGQHRTGIEAGPRALGLASTLATMPGLVFGGLHAYDGHLHERNPEVRRASCDAAFAPVSRLRQDLEATGIAVPRVVAGGTPTFPFHAGRDRVECSPGTCVLWDAGYAANLPDLDFQPAAVLLSRVVSRPTPRRVCLDLGHKAVASEMPHPRVVFLNLEGGTPVAHNEEHLVIEMAGPTDLAVGECLYAIPWHVCPTVALHSELWVVENGEVRDRWPVLARARRLTI